MIKEVATIEPETAKAEDNAGEFEALQKIIAALKPLPEEASQRIFESAATFLKIINGPRNSQRSIGTTASNSIGLSQQVPFSEDSSMPPKEFLFEKQPRTDVERIACLAFYLTHYRSTPHFKTLDLSKLNTEAAQPKFANAAYTANNAVKMGYLVPSTVVLVKV